MILVVENAAECPSGLYGELLETWGIPHALWRPHAEEAAPPLEAVRGVLVLGGPMGVHDEGEHPFLRTEKDFLRDLLRRDIPCFGICLGGQLLAEVLGAPVYSRRCGEQGCNLIQLTEAGRRDPLFSGLGDPFLAYHWHNDSFAIPDGALHLAFTEVCAGQAFRWGRAWGVQFHPEVDAAIVADWLRQAQADDAPLRAFRRQETQLRRVGTRLLRNFLQITGSAPSIP